MTKRHHRSGRPSLDVAAVFAAVNEQREQRGLAWKTVAKELGYGLPHLNRFLATKTLDVDLFCRLLLWLGETDFTVFLAEESAGEQASPERPPSRARTPRPATDRFRSPPPRRSFQRRSG